MDCPSESRTLFTSRGRTANRFRYSADDDLYIFNLGTKDPSFLDYYTYEAEVALDDGSTHSVAFSLK